MQHIYNVIVALALCMVATPVFAAESIGGNGLSGTFANGTYRDAISKSTQTTNDSGIHGGDKVQ